MSIQPTSRRKLLGAAAAAAALGGAATTLGGFAQPARATYGSSSAAVTSPAPARKLSIEEFEKLGARKLKQREGALGSEVVEQILKELEAGVEDLSKQTESLAEELNRDRSGLAGLFAPQKSQKDTEQVAELLDIVEKEKKAREAAIEKVLAAKDELVAQVEQRRQIEADLKKRAAILRKLDAQPAWVSYAVAAAASCISTGVMHPVDTIKTRLQANKAADVAGPDAKRSPGGPRVPLEPLNASFDRPAAANATDDAHHAVAEDTGALTLLADVKELYRGLSGNLAKEAPSSALYLGVYEVVKTALLATTFGAENALLVYLIAGGAGEFCGSIIRAPAEALKTMTQSGLAEDFGDAGRQLLTDASLRSTVLFAWSSSLFRDVPMGAIQITVFEGLKTFILQSPDIVYDVNTLQAEALLGALGGALGALATTPTDVITTRIITDASGELQGMSVLDLGKAIVDDGGVLALFEGARERVLYWAPAISIFLACYCSIRQTLALNGIL